jgi:hypothetical protein
MGSPGVPLTSISKEVGTSVQMIEKHYARRHRELGWRVASAAPNPCRALS